MLNKRHRDEYYKTDDGEWTFTFNYARLLGESLEDIKHIDVSIWTRFVNNDGKRLCNKDVQFWFEKDVMKITSGAYHDEALSKELVDIIVQKFGLEKYMIK